MSHSYEDITRPAGPGREILHQAVECGHVQWIGQDQLADPAPIPCDTCPAPAGERTWRRAVVMG